MGIAAIPATEPTFTMRPLPRLRINGSAAFTMRATPQKFVSKSACAASSGTSSTGPKSITPALFTSASSLPARRSISATHAAGACSSQTSSSSISIPASARAAAARAEDAIAAREKASAAPSPLPDEAPVTNTTRLLIRAP